MSFDYLYSLTPRQFYNIQVGWNTSQELQTKTSWEQTRTLYDSIIRPNLKDRDKSVRDILPFPWDVPVKNEDLGMRNSDGGVKEELSFEEMEAQWADIDRKEVVSTRKF